MTGPNLATRAGAAILRLRHPPAGQPPAGQPPAGQTAAAQPVAGQAPGEQPPEGQPPRPESTGGEHGTAWPARAVALVRRHWLLSVLLAAGLVLRVLVMAAYHPALVYVDTLKYLYGASPGSEPFGYTVILKVILAVGDLGTVALIQHLLGLAMAVTLYAVLLRRGAARWLAALAVAPVLLDAYELQMEHMIMPDVWFEAIVVAGLTVLLWRPAVTVPFAAVAGLLLGSAATVMQLGVVLVVPAVVYLLAAGGPWRRTWTTTVALAMAFALVILGYSSLSYARNGHFWLARKQALTGRLVAAADCATLKAPRAALALCPTPAQQALGPDWLEHSGASPLFANPVPPGVKRGPLIGDLNAAILSQQRLRVLGSIARDAARLFALTRDQALGVTPIGRWQFQDGYPTYPPWVNACPAGTPSPHDCLTGQQAIQQRVAPVTDLLVRPGGTIVVGVQLQVGGVFHAHLLKPAYGGPARVDRPLARFLRSYQLDGGYTPGPLLALLGLAGLAGSFLLMSRRLRGPARQLALGCLLFTGTAVVVLFAPDIYQFSWRYELPVVITLIPAGALGIAALWGFRNSAKKTEDATGAVAGTETAEPA